MRIMWHTDDPPPVEEEYLITTISGNLCVAKWVDNSYFGGHWGWRSNNMFLKVAAWMPLPEPYKEV